MNTGHGHRSSVRVHVGSVGAQRTDGVTASFIKELLRRAALVAAEADNGPDAEGEPIRVTDAHLAAALDQLLDVRSALTQTLLGGGPAQPGPARFPR